MWIWGVRTENVSAHADNLLDNAEVVLKVVLLLGVEHVTGVANSTLSNTTSLKNSLDTDLELLNIVKRIEDTEDVDTVLLGLLDEVEDGVVRKRGVRNTVGSAEKHLEGNVGYELAHLPQAVPRIFVQEAHGNIEGSATPALQGPGVGVSVGGLLGDVEQVDGSHTGSEERLMGVTPGGVHNETALVLADGLREALRTLLEEDVPPALLAWLGSVDLVTSLIGEDRDGDLALELRLANLALDLTAVDSEVTKVRKQLLGTVLGADKIEKRRCVVDEGGPALAVNEDRVCEELDQERNVGLDTTDTELDQCTKHLSASDLVCRTTACALDQHGIVVRSDDSTCETVSSLITCQPIALRGDDRCIELTSRRTPLPPAER